MCYRKDTINNSTKTLQRSFNCGAIADEEQQFQDKFQHQCTFLQQNKFSIIQKIAFKNKKKLLSTKFPATIVVLTIRALNKQKKSLNKTKEHLYSILNTKENKTHKTFHIVRTSFFQIKTIKTSLYLKINRCL